MGRKVNDYIAEMSKEDYQEFFANIEKEEATLREFLGKVYDVSEELLVGVAEMLGECWELEPESEDESIVDHIVNLYKCELTMFYDFGVNSYIEDIKVFINENMEAFGIFGDELSELCEIE